uniref:Uncharacterized protein n=1 Tax=Anguilla anguilla TaxID=7936 RepID=A0A0E9XE36_ANGAN
MRVVQTPSSREIAMGACENGATPFCSTVFPNMLSALCLWLHRIQVSSQFFLSPVFTCLCTVYMQPNSHPSCMICVRNVHFNTVNWFKSEI